MISEGKEDGPIYPIFLTPSESEAPVLRYSDKHFQELLQEPHHIQLMELRASAIRWKIRLWLWLWLWFIFHVINHIQNKLY